MTALIVGVAPAYRGAMQSLPILDLTICGLADLDYHSARGVTHVLSILDPNWPEPEVFWAYDPHHRTTLHFHDIIDPAPEGVLPTREHVEAILAFGHFLDEGSERQGAHLLVHCHMGVSRSTAAVAILLAQRHPEYEENYIFSRLLELRPQAWPNSRMIGFADELLGRAGRLIDRNQGSLKCCDRDGDLIGIEKASELLLHYRAHSPTTQTRTIRGPAC